MVSSTCSRRLLTEATVAPMDSQLICALNLDQPDPGILLALSESLDETVLLSAGDAGQVAAEFLTGLLRAEPAFGSLGQGVAPAVEVVPVLGVFGAPCNEILGNYSACVDYPTASFYQELMQHYPNAKVILSVRDTSSWVESMQTSILKAMHTMERFPRPLKWLLGIGQADKMIDAVFRREFGDNYNLADSEFMARRFEERNDSIRRVVPSERLLEFRVSDGWAPLCQFLNLPVPDKPFPRLNDRKQVERALNIMTAITYVSDALATASCIGLAVWIEICNHRPWSVGMNSELSAAAHHRDVTRHRAARRPNSLLLSPASESASVSILIGRLEQSLASTSTDSTAAVSWSLLQATYSAAARRSLLISSNCNSHGSFLSRLCDCLLQVLLPLARQDAALQETAGRLLCALANLTCGDSTAKQLVTLHADGALTSAAAAQLHQTDFSVGLAAAALLRNLGWQPRPDCRRRLRLAGAAVSLMRFVQRLAALEATSASRLRCPLAALWNLTDSSGEEHDHRCSPAELLAVCDVPDGVRCLFECLASPDVDVVESSGGVLRNLTPALLRQWDQLAPSVLPALPLLVKMLDIGSANSASSTTLTMAANACRLIACISGAGRPRERRLLLSLGAEPGLRWLQRLCRHRSVREDCRTALSNLLASSAAKAAAASVTSAPLSPSTPSMLLRPSSSIASDRELSPLVEEVSDPLIGEDAKEAGDHLQQPPPQPMSLLPSLLSRPSATRSVAAASRPLGIVAPMPKAKQQPPQAQQQQHQKHEQHQHQTQQQPDAAAPDAAAPAAAASSRSSSSSRAAAPAAAAAQTQQHQTQQHQRAAPDAAAPAAAAPDSSRRSSTAPDAAAPDAAAPAQQHQPQQHQTQQHQHSSSTSSSTRRSSTRRSSTARRSSTRRSSTRQQHSSRQQQQQQQMQQQRKKQPQEHQQQQQQHFRLSSSLSKDSGYADEVSSTISASLSPQSPPSQSLQPSPASRHLPIPASNSSRLQRTKLGQPTSGLAVPHTATAAPTGIPVKSSSSGTPSGSQKSPSRSASGIPRSSSVRAAATAQSNIRPPSSLGIYKNGIALRQSTMSRRQEQKRCSAPPN
uniref:Protein kinase domain-containing protein n=1 Tax=Macrostomum lignano TaxID=282301 RepID=A0A1I8IQZ4_9PLAT